MYSYSFELETPCDWKNVHAENLNWQAGLQSIGGSTHIHCMYIMLCTLGGGGPPSTNDSLKSQNRY